MKGEKITYTYNGITFETASKVVMSMWTRGKHESAYKRYISDTTGRRLRDSDIGKKTRLNTLRSIEKAKGEKKVKAMKKTAEESAKVSRRMAEASRLQSINNWFALSESQTKDRPHLRKLSKTIRKITEHANEKYTADTTKEIIEKVESAVRTFEQNAPPEEQEHLQKVIATVRAEIANLKYRPQKAYDRSKKRCGKKSKRRKK